MRAWVVSARRWRRMIGLLTEIVENQSKRAVRDQERDQEIADLKRRVEEIEKR